MSPEWRPADDASRAVQRAAASMYIPASPAEEAREWLHGWQLNAAQSVLAAALDVEEMARVMAGIKPGEDWPTNDALGGGLTGTRDDEFRDGMLDEARSLRAALLGSLE